MDDLAPVKRSYAIAHLEQLKKVNPSLKSPKKKAELETYYEILTGYTNANLTTIKSAIAKSVYSKGNPTVDWQIVFYSFMESCATYLRDTTALAKAVKLYTEATEGDELDQVKEAEALTYYYASTKQISDLALQWGMNFIMICDLWDDPNVPYISPYCGVFYTQTNANSPFIGLAFKGTNPGAIWEDDIDWNYQPLVAPAGVLFGSSVSTGVYTSLFSKFTIGGNGNTPFEYIQATVTAFSDLLARGGTKTVPTHVTGHSLGASYSCMSYAQLVINAAKSTDKYLRIGDLYNFGCPRVGLIDWANSYYAAMQKNTGISCRVVNSSWDLGDDYVTQVPPIWQLLPYEGPWFNHIDSGWRISPTSGPVSIPSERGTLQKGPSSEAILALDNHPTSAYYASLVNTLKMVGEQESADAKHGGK